MKNLYSMTGFGKSSVQLTGKKLSLELRSLNSKQADINLRVPANYRAVEADIRQQLAGALLRGKIECLLTVEITGTEASPKINEALALGYLAQLQALAAKTGVQGDVLAAVLRLPDVIQSREEAPAEAEWKAVQQILAEAIAQLQRFRSDEGGRLRHDLEERLALIAQALAAVEPLEAERRSNLEEKLRRSLEQLAQQADAERFEQELIYYLEKWDITEEKVRLRSHLQYFAELMGQGEAVGKKLGFVAQEIGREINTLGSKANHAGMQKLVVDMKDELEKIKEQVLNIL